MSKAVGTLVVSWLVLTAFLWMVARPSATRSDLDINGGARLVVLVHGLAGREAMEPVVDLARQSFVNPDILTFAYDARAFSNADLFGVTNELEDQIHAASTARQYESILLVGHSLGAMVLRKALIWGHGLESDRNAPKGKRQWVDRVDRMVSLAGINRGWSINPRPEQMGPWRYLTYWVGERLARLTGTGRLMLAVQRGAPYIADSRVQWIQLTRPDSSNAPVRHVPQVIHLLGDRDDIVTRADATDLGVAKNTVFVTVAGTDHVNILATDSPRRVEQVRLALVGDVARLSPDHGQELTEDRSVRRVIYLMHGIRDYGEWTDRLRAAIQQDLGSQTPHGSPAEAVVVNKKYGYFPMLPFLLYWDRQDKVRRFMDEYTENVARYPNARQFDFVGHSNGTYILASALQRYRTLKIGRVYFAGSVVPKHYPWRPLLDAGRVQRVVNVVGAGDWVVAIFPKLFEQVADWLTLQPTTGVLDIGAAGFRGFQAGDDPAGRVLNVAFANGVHDVGVDMSDDAKLKALAAYVVKGDEVNLTVFRDATGPWGWLDVLSNISWFPWAVLIGGVTYLGSIAFRKRRLVGVVYVLIVVALLTSV